MAKKSTRRTFIKTVSTAILVSPALSTIRSVAGAQDTPPTPLRFAVASVGHFGQPGTNYQRFHEEMMEWLIEEKKGKGLDFVIFNGDLIHNEPEFLPQVKEYYDRLDVPYFVTKGNHDMASAKQWEEVWGYGENHDFDKGDCAFLLGTTSNVEGEYLCVNIDWLKERLAHYREKRHIFAFFHISQHKVTKHGIDCPDVSSLLESTPNVAAVFHGHDHDIDSFIYSNERAYLFDGHIGGNWGTNYRGYRIVEVDQEGTVSTYQCNPEAFIVNKAKL